MIKLFEGIGQEARATARAAAVSFAAMVLILIGVGFLTVALWMFITIHESALFAATAIGALYCAVGFIVLAINLSGRKTIRDTGTPREAPQAPPEPRDPIAQVVEGFMIGLQAGRSSARRD